MAAWQDFWLAGWGSGGAEFTSTATWVQAPASWAATATEAFASTATFTQAAAGWAATASETFAATATFTQAAATWAAVATEAFAATGSWTQAAAAWSAIAAETFTSTATWTQAAATWDALAAATGGGAHDFTGAWDQTAASWASEVAVPPPPVTDMGGWSRVRQQFTLPDPDPIHMVARFRQEPATWRADMDNNDDDIALGLTEEHLLVLV